MTDQLAQPAAIPSDPTPTGPIRRAYAWLDSHARPVALVAVGLCLVIAGGYALVLGGALRYFDEQVYVELTRSLAQGHGYTLDGVQPTAYRPPGYPFLLLPAYLLTGGSVLAMRLVGVLCLAGTAWFSFLVGRRLHTPATGALAALVVAIYPLLTYTATTLYPQVPAAFLLLVMIEVGLRAIGPDQATRPGRRLLAAAGCGLAGGLLTLAVPTFAVTVIGFVAWLLWRQWRAARRLPVRVVAVLLAATAVLPVAWCVRNAVALHAFVPVSTNNGINLLLGNSAGATPGGGRTEDLTGYENHAATLHLSEAALDSYYSGVAVDWIKANPGRAAVLYLEKVANNFSYHDELATAGQNNTAQDLLSAVSYYPILALALLRVLMWRRRKLTPAERVLLWTIVLNVLLLAVFFTRLRFRIPLDVPTILLAASAVTNLPYRTRVTR